MFHRSNVIKRKRINKKKGRGLNLPPSNWFQLRELVLPEHDLTHELGEGRVLVSDNLGSVAKDASRVLLDPVLNGGRSHPQLFGARFL